MQNFTEERNKRRQIQRQTILDSYLLLGICGSNFLKDHRVFCTLMVFLSGTVFHRIEFIKIETFLIYIRRKYYRNLPNVFYSTTVSNYFALVT